MSGYRAKARSEGEVMFHIRMYLPKRVIDALKAEAAGKMQSLTMFLRSKFIRMYPEPVQKEDPR